MGIDDVRTGALQRINTLGGPANVYMFNLEIRLSAVGTRFGAQIGFFPTHVARNILGRGVLFSAFEIGFRESTGEIHLRAE